MTSEPEPATPRRHLVGIWNPVYGSNVMETHLETLLAFARQQRDGSVTEDHVYVWWGKIRSPRRQQSLPHLEEILALETELNRNDPGLETHLYLTDYRSLYVAHVGEITKEDVRETEADHVPAYYRAKHLHCDCWFLLWDIRRLVTDDTASVVRELARLRNTRYHDQPVSIYGGMVDLPLIVTNTAEDRYFEASIRDHATEGKYWAEFDAERVGIGAMERELRENVLGDSAWGGLSPAARSFIATGEKIYRDHVSEPAFDFAPVILEFSKAIEVHCNFLLRRVLGAAPPDLRRLNVDGHTAELSELPPLSLFDLQRFIGGRRETVQYLCGRLQKGEWFTGSLPAVLGQFADTRNKAAHRERINRETAAYWRERLLGVGCHGEFAMLGQAQLRT